jgi:hypothetical protein
VPSLDSDAAASLQKTSGFPGSSGRSGWSFCFWFKPNNTSNRAYFAVDNASAAFWVIFVSSGNLIVDCDGGDTTLLSSIGTTEWLGLAGRFTSNTASRVALKRDGRAPVFFDCNGLGANPTGIYLSQDGFNEPGDALHRRFSIWDALLSDEELRNELRYWQPQRLNGLWHHEDLCGPIAAAGRDLSGRGNNFTRSGTWVLNQRFPAVVSDGRRPRLPRVADAISTSAYTMAADALALDLSATPTGLTAQRQLVAGAAALDLNAAAAALTHGFTVAVDALALDMAAPDATLIHGYVLTGSALALALAANAANFSTTRVLPAATLALDLNVSAAGLAAGRQLAAAPMALDLSAAAAGLVAARAIAAATLALDLALPDVVLTWSAGNVMVALAASLDLSAGAAGLQAAHAIAAQAAALDLGVADAGLQAARVLAAATLALDLQGNPATLTYATPNTLVAGAASLDLSANAANFARALLLQGGTLSLDLGAGDAALSRGIVMPAGAAALDLAAQDALFAVTRSIQTAALALDLVVNSATLSSSQPPAELGGLVSSAVVLVLQFSGAQIEESE